MPSWEKLLAKANAGPNNLTFREFCRLLEALGFVPRKRKGTSHVTFKHPLIAEVFTVQAGSHRKAVAWQVRKLLAWVEEYDLRGQREGN